MEACSTASGYSSRSSDWYQPACPAARSLRCARAGDQRCNADYRHQLPGSNEGREPAESRIRGLHLAPIGKPLLPIQSKFVPPQSPTHDRIRLRFFIVRAVHRRVTGKNTAIVIFSDDDTTKLKTFLAISDLLKSILRAWVANDDHQPIAHQGGSAQRPSPDSGPPGGAGGATGDGPTPACRARSCRLR